MYSRRYVAPELGPGMDQFPTIAHTTTRGPAQALFQTFSTATGIMCFGFSARARANSTGIRVC